MKDRRNGYRSSYDDGYDDRDYDDRDYDDRDYDDRDYDRRSYSHQQEDAPSVGSRVASTVGSFVKRSCLTVFVGMIAFFLLLWGIGTCIGVDPTDDNKKLSADSAVVDDQRQSVNDNESTTVTDNTDDGDTSTSTLDDTPVEVPFDESSTVVLGE